MKLNPFSWFTKTAKPDMQEKGMVLADNSGIITLDMAAHLGGQPSYLKLDAVFACLRDKSETIGQLPLKIYELSRDNKRKPIHSGRTYRIFTQQPCDHMTMQEFIEMMVWWYERRGAFYAYVARNDRGNVSQIIPFANQQSVHAQMDVNGQVYYTYTTNDNKPVMTFRESDLMIIKAGTMDGYTPIGALEYNATLLGIAKSQEDAYSSLQSNGITSQMALATDNVFNDKNALTRLQSDWQNYRGTKGRTSIPVFENGIKPVKLSLTPQEQELLNSRSFSVNRICRIFRVPIHRVGVQESAVDAKGVFELDEAYMRDSLNPIMCKFEYAINKLVGDSYLIEFNRRSYFAGSPWRLAEAIDKTVKGGLMSINEGREDLGLEPID
ncbi:MAG: phage portal protein, partial [Shewanella sp.]